MLEKVDMKKYLGVHIDKNLTFDDHTQYIIKMVNQQTKLAWKMRNYIDESLAK